jgi:membrane-bound inhibitor of C-type lysozyme
MRKLISISFVLLLAAAQAWGQTVTKVGQGSSDFVTTLVLTTTAGVSTGHGIVIVLWSNKDCTSGTNGISSVTDNASTPNTYARAITNWSTDISTGSCMYYAPVTSAVASGGTITITYAGSSGWNAIAYDVSSMATSSIVTSSGGLFQNFGAGSDPTTVTASGAISTESVVIASFAGLNANTFNAYDGNYTGLDNGVNGSGGRYLNTEYRVLSTGTPSATLDWTGDLSHGASCLIASFKTATVAARRRVVIIQ